MKSFFTLLVMFFVVSVNAQITFSDDFEAYTVNAFVAKSNPKWTTWSNKPGTSEDAKITDEVAKSGKQSLKIINTVATGGATDLVLPFGGKYTTGSFSFKLSMLIPEGKNAYFNFQATQTIGQTWAIDANFDENGSFTISRSSVPLLNTNVPKGKWFDMEILINLTSNVWKVLIDGECRGAFSNTTNSVASVDFFPINSASLYYLDDVSYSYSAAAPGFALDGGVTDFVWNNGKLAGTTQAPAASLRNNGSTAITDAEVLVRVLQEGVIVDESTKNITGINLAKGQKTAFNLPEITLGPGNNKIEVNINKLNGVATDEETCNNTLNFSLQATQAAAHRAVLVEEGTGPWCQWCPRGAVFMDRYNEYYKDLFIPIAVHNGSTNPMLLAEYNTFMAFSSFPNSRLNRKADQDPSQTENPFLKEIALSPKASLLPGARYNAATKKLDVSVEVEFLEAAAGDFYLSVVLTEDGVRGTTSAYNQANAYAGGANGVMGGYELLPNPVPASKMVYHHVARAVNGLRDNGTNAFSGAYVEGEKILMNASFTLNAAWKPDSLHIIPILLESAEGYINAASATLAKATENGYLSSSEAQILPENQVAIYPNPSNEAVYFELSASTPGNVSVSVFDVTGQQVAYKDYGTLTGEYILPLQINALAPGIYTAKLTTGAGSLLKKMVVTDK
jgi:hypothetical protein